MPSSLPSTAPIGIFDSGVGGLSVLRIIRNALPNERLIYVADSAHAPYGDRHPDFIEARALEMVQFLVNAGVKAIVVACNTATVVAIEKLRSLHSLPIVALEPAIKPAVEHTKSRVVGVLATQRTVESSSVARLCELYGESARIILQPCPGLVEQVERGETESERTRHLLEGYISTLLAAGADTLVLGCTHYPFLESQIRNIVGPDICMIESSAAVARQLKRRLGENGCLASEQHAPSEQFFTTDAPDKMRALMSMLWGADVEVQGIV